MEVTQQNQIALLNGLIYTGTEIISDQALLIQGSIIEGFVDPSDIPSDFLKIDLEGMILAPGFIDLQIYGGGGILFAEKPTRESLETISKAILKTGTTSYLLTLATNTQEVFDQAISVAKEYLHPACLGLHFEGPYLHPNKRGAHPNTCLKTPQVKELKECIENAAGTLKMMTIAPELFEKEELDLLIQHGVLLSAGHSDANYETAYAGFQHGIKAVTHLFNAMSPLHHRNPGLPGATFMNPNIQASIIVDGIHVAYETVAISKKIMGERLFLITDAVEESFSGTYTHQRQGDHFILPDGTLSGSALTMLQAVKNCVQHVGIPLEEALRMATLYPAKLIKHDNMGHIKEGSLANLIVFDADFQVQYVFLEGQKINS